MACHKVGLMTWYDRPQWKKDKIGGDRTGRFNTAKWGGPGQTAKLFGFKLDKLRYTWVYQTTLPAQTRRSQPR